MVDFGRYFGKLVAYERWSQLEVQIFIDLWFIFSPPHKNHTIVIVFFVRSPNGSVSKIFNRSQETSDQWYNHIRVTNAKSKLALMWLNVI